MNYDGQNIINEILRYDQINYKKKYSLKSQLLSINSKMKQYLQSYNNVFHDILDTLRTFEKIMFSTFSTEQKITFSVFIQTSMVY